MRGVVQQIPGELSSLTVIDNIEIPAPKGRQIMLRVECTALNRLDLLQVNGFSSPPPGKNR